MAALHRPNDRGPGSPAGAYRSSARLISPGSGGRATRTCRSRARPIGLAPAALGDGVGVAGAFRKAEVLVDRDDVATEVADRVLEVIQVATNRVVRDRSTGVVLSSDLDFSRLAARTDRRARRDQRCRRPSFDRLGDSPKLDDSPVQSVPGTGFEPVRPFRVRGV